MRMYGCPPKRSLVHVLQTVSEQHTNLRCYVANEDTEVIDINEDIKIIKVLLLPTCSLCPNIAASTSPFPETSQFRFPKTQRHSRSSEQKQKSTKRLSADSIPHELEMPWRRGYEGDNMLPGVALRCALVGFAALRRSLGRMNYLGSSTWDGP